MVVHAFSPSPWEADAGESQLVLGLHSELQERQSYREKPGHTKMPSHVHQGKGACLTQANQVSLSHTSRGSHVAALREGLVREEDRLRASW